MPRFYFLSYLIWNPLILEAEDAQAKIEELRDNLYNEQRTELLAHNDSETSQLLQQKEDTFMEFK